MSKPVEALREALYECGLVQPLNSTSKGGSISFMCRQIPGQEKGWVTTIDNLLAVGEREGVDLHICRRYVRKEGKMVFGWFLGVEAKNAKALVPVAEELVKVLKASNSLFAPHVSPTPSTVPQATPPPERQEYRKGFDLKKFTDAVPRAPEFSGPDPKVPQNAQFRLKSSANGREMEMPLPHIYTREINAPKPGSNKGAAATGSNELFKGLRT